MKKSIKNLKSKLALITLAAILPLVKIELKESIPTEVRDDPEPEPKDPRSYDPKTRATLPTNKLLENFGYGSKSREDNLYPGTGNNPYFRTEGYDIQSEDTEA
tara:strand:- start:895 stop:1203 length:309 start_codon:yes stop_codon:yes gene_type:complete